MLELVKAHSAADVAAALRETPALLGVKDPRGRSWLHLCCAVKVHEKGMSPARSIKTAQALLDAGLGLNDAAFVEGEFRATPLWYAIAHAKNLQLAKHLLELGCDPNNCMWAAAFNDDVAALRLLASHGAPLNLSQEDASPFLFAVQWSRFAAAEELLKLGADVDFQSSKKVSALHSMLKKGTDKKHFRMLAKYRPRVDLPDKNGRTAAAIMHGKRDPFFRELAEQLAAGARW